MAITYKIVHSDNIDNRVNFTKLKDAETAARGITRRTGEIVKIYTVDKPGRYVQQHFIAQTMRDSYDRIWTDLTGTCADLFNYPAPVKS